MVSGSHEKEILQGIKERSDSSEITILCQLGFLTSNPPRENQRPAFACDTLVHEIHNLTNLRRRFEAVRQRQLRPKRVTLQRDFL